jgi:hypothetical protein
MEQDMFRLLNVRIGRVHILHSLHVGHEMIFRR